MTRLLVVDDHDGFRVAVRLALERAGLDVVGEAADGASAMATAEALRPDAVLLDVGLPDLDGFEVCEHICALGIVVVMMSSRSVGDYADRMAVTSARGFLAKAALSANELADLLA